MRCPWILVRLFKCYLWLSSFTKKVCKLWIFFCPLRIFCSIFLVNRNNVTFSLYFSVVFKFLIIFFLNKGNEKENLLDIQLLSLTRGLNNLWKRVFRDITNRQTDRQTDRQTLRLYDWIDPVGWFSENYDGAKIL